MKILHIVPTYLPAYRYGGPIQSVHDLNKYLVRAGADVTVYTTAIDGPRDLDVPLGVPVDRDGVKVFYFAPGRRRRWFFAPEMRRALRAHAAEFDIIHITSVFLSASTLGARAARRSGKPYIISPRGSLMRAPLQQRSALKKNLYLQFIERRNLKHAAAIHFTTELEHNEYLDLGYPLRKSIVIPNGFDPASLPPGDATAFRKKSGIGADRKMILSLGRLSWKKGFDTLIPAFAAVVKDVPEAILVIAGGDDENYKETLNKLIEAAEVAGADIADKVVFTGPLEGAEKASAYQAAALFALPSYAENFAMTVVEAAACGVPVVITKEVGVAPEIQKAGAGIVVKKDIAEVAAAMIKLLKDPAGARAMGEKGKAFAAGLAPEEMAQAFFAAYNSIIADQPNAPVK